MKMTWNIIRICSLALAGVFLFMLASMAVELTSRPRPAIAAPTKPMLAADPLNVRRPYANAITVNDIRVTLLSIARTTMFESDENGNKSAVPYLQITYTTESLGTEIIRAWKTGPESLEVDGRKDDMRITCEIVCPIASLPHEPYSVDVSNEKRATAKTIWFKEDGTNPGLATLVLHEGINERSELFRFENIPLR